MTPLQAQSSIKAANTELFDLTPSSPVTLFEIDVSNQYYENSSFTSDMEPIFRFHNNLKLYDKNIIWQGNIYYPAPILAEDFEYSAQGSLPTPKLTLSVNDLSINELRRLKLVIKNYDDLTGAKVTRRRTFAQFLDAENWILIGGTPSGYTPDPNSEFTSDIYYISRKSADNKNSIQFELTSVLDLEGLKLPLRVVLQDRCVATYRGIGCLYEYSSRLDTEAHGDIDSTQLPLEAPPVANFKDELFTDLLGISSLSDKGEYNNSMAYKKGDHFYVTKNSVKFYFVTKVDAPINTAPPNENYYISDECGHLIRSCGLRWRKYGENGPNKGGLMYNGFPSVNKFS
jgi:lambda family phage minor tail protein L